MELKSTINEWWKLCTFGSFICCFILLLSLNQTQNPSFSRLTDTLLDFLPLPADQNYPPTSFITTSDPKPEPEPVLEPKPEPLNSTTLMINPEPEPEPEIEPSNLPNADIRTVDQTNKKVNLAKINPMDKQMNKRSKKCNMYEGRWIYKPEVVPSYNSTVCPFLEEKMSCQKNGRPDSDYENWIWEATDCVIPLFNGTDMLERMRNKRMIIAGDSLNRNQWESLACLLYSSISPSRAKVDAGGSTYKVLKAKDYNFTLEFYWSPFLVEFDQSQDNKPTILVLDKISAPAKHWLGADVMVFNSGHWWIHLGKFKAWDMIQYKGKLITEMPVEQQYELGMTTWAKWIEANVDPNKTTVYFRSISTEHGGKQWCYKATQPILDESYKSHFPKSIIDIAEAKIKGIRSSSSSKSQLQVKYLNITKLSGYRRDAHPSIFRTQKWKLYTTKYQRLIPSYADCSHWCLPGLPDTWNRLLYASLFF